jgi:hypothetical protein
MRELTTSTGRVYQLREDDSEVRIDWTPPAPVAGFSQFTFGEVNESRKEGTIVTFSEEVTERRKTQTISARVKGRPDLAELVRLAEAMQAEIEAAFVAAAGTTEPSGYLYESGCDTASTYRPLYATSLNFDTQELVEKRLRTDLIERHLRGEDFNAVADATGAELLAANLSTYGGFRFGVEGFRQLLALATERQAVIDAKAMEKKSVRDAARTAKIQVAKDTGQPVEIERWSEPCDGSQDECDLDIISRVAMPDGKIVTHRSHTH